MSEIVDGLVDLAAMALGLVEFVLRILVLLLMALPFGVPLLCFSECGGQTNQLTSPILWRRLDVGNR